MSNKKLEKTVPAIQFTQWLTHWDEFEYSAKRPNRKPKPSIYMFTMNATELRGGLARL